MVATQAHRSVLSHPSPGDLSDPFCIVALGVSARGLSSLSVILKALPKSFPAPVLIVQHLSADFRSQTADLLRRQTPLRVKDAQEGDIPRAGWVYIAPPARHLLIRPDGTLGLSVTEKVHDYRPSIDVLFSSLAVSAGARVVGIVLTGGGSDGSAGVHAIKTGGGVVIAQEQEDGETGGVDFVLPLEEIAAKLIALTQSEAMRGDTGTAGNLQNARDNVTEAMKKRATLTDRKAISASATPALMHQMLEELTLCLEELGIAQETLRLQNEALVEAFDEAETERLRYRVLFEGISDALLVTDADGMILEVNPAAALLLGAGLRFLIGGSASRFVPKEERDMLLGVLRTLKGATAWQGSLRLQTRRGKAFDSAVTITPTPAILGVPAALRWLIRPA